ncbi:MAG: 2-dehydropantoate 2-reductase [Pseudomonadota bacterium]
MEKKRICIFGAGSIGCYVGGRLAAAGCDVTLIGRKRIHEEIRGNGLRITDFCGTDMHVPPEGFRFETEADAAADADLVIVTVKSAGTLEAGKTLAARLQTDAVVVSFQNGLGNTEWLRKALPGRTVLAGVVQFNVLNRGLGNFHQGSEGRLEVEQHPDFAPFTPCFARAGLPVKQRKDIQSVQWAKLLINLNNPINALSNLPLKAQLSQRPFRQCFAMAQKEALAILNAAHIRPARLTPLPANWIPGLLKAPDGLFRMIAGKMLAIDPLARSSMWEDLEAGRKTEIDYLNGEIVRMAKKLGRPAPVNARLMELIRDAEAGKNRIWTGEDLWNELVTARHRVSAM